MTDIDLTMELHAKWLSGVEGGERVKLQGADLREADLRGANLREADLQEADLRDVSLQRADLRGANIDFASWPLWCGSRDVVVDTRIAAQIAAHFCVLKCDDPDFLKARAAIIDFARTSHRAGELGLTEAVR